MVKRFINRTAARVLGLMPTWFYKAIVRITRKFDVDALLPSCQCCGRLAGYCLCDNGFNTQCIWRGK